MIFEEIIKPEKIFPLISTEKDDALGELINFYSFAHSDISKTELVEKLYEREAITNTYIGNGIAIPHAKLETIESFDLIVGISKTGVHYNNLDGSLVHLIILIVGTDQEPNKYLNLLSSIARFFKKPEVVQKIIEISSPEEIYSFIIKQSQQTKIDIPLPKNPQLKKMLDCGFALFKALHANFIIIYYDIIDDWSYIKKFGLENRIIIATKKEDAESLKNLGVAAIIELPDIQYTRTTLIRMALLLSLVRGIVTLKDNVLFFSGMDNIQKVDTIITIDLSNTQEYFINPVIYETDIDAKPEVVEKVLELASQLANEGREGNPVGTIFVLGDSDNVKQYCNQLIINPFIGYREKERNILDPSLSETIKEFSRIDGAFIIRGDGVIISAGTYLKPSETVQLGSGYGSRHVVAASISKLTNALVFAISESSGLISVFKNGGILTTISRAY